MTGLDQVSDPEYVFILQAQGQAYPARKSHPIIRAKSLFGGRIGGTGPEA